MNELHTTQPAVRSAGLRRRQPARNVIGPPLLVQAKQTLLFCKGSSLMNVYVEGVGGPGRMWHLSLHFWHFLHIFNIPCICMSTFTRCIMVLWKVERQMENSGLRFNSTSSKTSAYQLRHIQIFWHVAASFLSGPYHLLKWKRRVRGGDWRMMLSATTKCPHVLYDNSATWRVWATMYLSSLSRCLVSGRSFSSKAKGDNPDENHSICGQLQGRFSCTNVVAVPARLLRPLRSFNIFRHVVHATSTSVRRERMGSAT